MEKVNTIPAMSPTSVHTYLEEIGATWSGQGVAVEVGCWLGATSAPLLRGLVKAGYNKPFWAFDKWCANESEVVKSFNQGLSISLGQNLQPLYLSNVQSIYANVRSIRGRVPNTLKFFHRSPVEFCMFDAPKREPVFSAAVKAFVPLFIPGVTVFGLLDYYFYVRRREMGYSDWEQFLAPVKFVKKHTDSFTLLREFPEDGSCAFFKYEKPCRGL